MNQERLYELVNHSQDGKALKVEECFKEIIAEKIEARLVDLKTKVFTESEELDELNVGHAPKTVKLKDDDYLHFWYANNKGRGSSNVTIHRSKSSERASMSRNQKDVTHSTQTSGYAGNVNFSKRIKGHLGLNEEFDLEEAVHPLDAHRILSQNGGRDKNFFSLSSEHVDGLTKAAKDLGYRHSGKTGKSYTRAFHDHLTSRADKFVDHDGRFKPGMRDKFNESTEFELEEDFAGVRHEGGPLNGKIDKRYSITKEFTGHATAQHVARFAGDYLGSHETKEGAKEIAQRHSDQRHKMFAGIRENISRNANEMGIELSEEELYELSKKTLGSYVKNSSLDMSTNYGSLLKAKPSDTKKIGSLVNKFNKRRKGIDTAVKKLTKENAESMGLDLSEEELDELSKKTLGSYAKKAGKSFASNATRSQSSYENGDMEGSMKSRIKASKRQKGMERAIDKLTKENAEAMGLDLSEEKLDELSQKTMERYLSANTKRMGKAFKEKDDVNKEKSKRGLKLASKRMLGVKESVDLEEGKKQEANEHAATELHLYATNDSHLHHHSALPIIDNLKRKVKKGTYDHEKATKLWRYHADRAADKYKKEFGTGHFTPATRDMAAKEMRDHYDEHVRG